MHVHGNGGAHGARGRDHHHGAPHRHDHALATGDGGAFAIAVAINGAYVVGEAIAGVFAHSLALLADAGHNVGDVLGLLASWLAIRLGRVRPTARFTYGLRGSSILAALGNAIVLLLVTGGIAAEALERVLHPAPTAGLMVCAVAVGGIVVNGGTALLFMRGRGADLNRRAAFAHMAADAGVAGAVALAGVAVACTGWRVIDPLVSLLVSIVIVVGTWSLLRDSIGFALDAVPPGVDRDAVARFLAGVPGVAAVHDLHIWGMSTTETALTAHLVCPDRTWADAQLAAVAMALRQEHGIVHTTLQIEQGDAAHPCLQAHPAVV